MPEYAVSNPTHAPPHSARYVPLKDIFAERSPRSPSVPTATHRAPTATPSTSPSMTSSLTLPSTSFTATSARCIAPNTPPPDAASYPMARSRESTLSSVSSLEETTTKTRARTSPSTEKMSRQMSVRIVPLSPSGPMPRLCSQRGFPQFLKDRSGKPPKGTPTKGRRKMTGGPGTPISRKVTSPSFAPRGKEDYLGPYLLKRARGLMIGHGDGNLEKALELALRATKSFETSPGPRPNLDLVMCLHVVSALYCRLGQHTEAIPILVRSIRIPNFDAGLDHALAKFTGCMQLGDTYSMLGQIKNSIAFYTAGLEIQQWALGEKDPRYANTCRYLAEAHIQAIQLDEAERLCLLALDIHKQNNRLSLGSPEEAVDRQLLGLIFESRGAYETALEHYVLAGMSMAANGRNADVAAIDCSIGDVYLSLAQYDEAMFVYQKALNTFKSSMGESHPSVAMVFVRLANLYSKISKLSESKSFCENAIRIYSKPLKSVQPDEIASSLVDISGIYESLNEPEKALELLHKAVDLYRNAPCQQGIVAGIEAQMGVLYYILGSYSESYESLKSSTQKFRETGEKKSAIFGMALNQMGLSCLQLLVINEAADLFEEARNILEAECGPYHANTLGVYSNLAGTYDAMGRTGDAIEIMEYVVELREERLGTANPDVDDEKRRLAELLKEAGLVRRRKSRSLETLLDNHNITAPFDVQEP